jgi:hypothetical protein
MLTLHVSVIRPWHAVTGISKSQCRPVISLTVYAPARIPCIRSVPLDVLHTHHIFHRTIVLPATMIVDRI